MWLFAGLGNPGDDYARNRHNIGFQVLDAVADGAVHFPPWRSKFSGAYSEARVAGEKVALLKPQTYMNESGQSVGAAAKFYKIAPERIMIFHDEIDLDPGVVRIKKGGGTAGHNGLKSIQAHLGTPEFWRVRIGVGHPGHKDKVSDYVLSNFAKAEESWVEAVIDALADGYEKIVNGDMAGYEKAVNAYVQRTAPTMKEASNGV